MADEGEYGELAEIGVPHYGGGVNRWGGGGGVNSPQHHHPHHQLHSSSNAASASASSRYAQRPPVAGSYEAEDAMARGGGSASGGNRGRSGLYYSPPGTSYTIVERPTTAPSSQHSLHHPGASKHPRGTYLGSSATFNNTRTHPTMSNGKKRPISPEQVLKLMGVGGGGGGGGAKATPGHGGGGGGGGSGVRRSAVSSPASSPASHLHHQNVQEDLLVRTVNMVRPADSPQGFGICVKGDVTGNSVYISRVEEHSVAERVGLRAGDTILEVNGTPFKGISHDDALKMLKSNRCLSMTVKSPNLLPYEPPPERGAPGGGGGGGAGPWVVRQTYSWMDRQGRPVSPPLEYARATPPVIVAPPPPPPVPRYYNRPLKDKGTRKVELCIDPGQSLGLMIRGGVEYNLGIFITGVDKDSVADRAGLVIGDQILEVNGQSFLDISHDDAVNQLKFYKRMLLTVRDVGKVPHSCTAYDDMVTWESATVHSPGHMGGVHKARSPALMMVEEKARILLKKSEFTTLAYYQEEYAARQMTIEAFVAVLLELLNTHEKYTLLTELREVVLPEDRSRFDELVYRREVEGQRCREFQDMLDQREHEKQGVGTSRQRGGGIGHGAEPNHALLMSNLHDLPGPDYGCCDGEIRRSRRHSSPEESRRGSLINEMDHQTSHYAQDANMGALVVTDQEGNLRITVKKTKPILGIAIEGGANTKHPLPRIINIHDNGAAFDAGGLEVGQLILEVDGQKIDGMQHQDVARLIAESFARRDRHDIEFLVIEAKKSNLEPKPTALIFLEA